ncbi:MAG: RHS repeat-associated core domain-containing protein [Patescibacteria group bacterium]
MTIVLKMGPAPIVVLFLATDPNGKVFQIVYDALDRPIEEKQPDIDNPSSLVTKTVYEYNDGILPRMVKRTDYLTGSSSGGSGGGTATFYAVPGDGQVSAGFQTMDWNQVHNSTYGTALDYTGTFSRAESNKSRIGNDEFRIYRGFMAFDTSSLPEDAVITSASLKLYVFDKDSADNDGNDFISAVSANQDSTSSLNADDYDQCGSTHTPAELSSRIDISSGITLDQYNSLSFNATGTSLINKSGWTKLGVREGHDIIDEAYAGPILSGNYILWNSVENASTSTRPYLEVSYNYPDFAGNIASYTYLDGFNRKTQERNKAEDGNTYSVKDYTYNKLGLLDKESLPYFSLNASSTPMTATSSLLINYTYDPLQRVTQVVNSVATTTNAYDDWKVTITDGENKIKDLYKDAYDNLIQVDEHNATSTYSTYYQYNLLGNLTKITDALSNIRNFTYDALGRRLTAQDLHASGDGTYGTWTYTFDDSGNLTSKLDPKNQTVNYTYDDLNRALTENYTGSAGTEVAYGYDTCTYGKGRLCSATTTASVLNLAYNPLGLVASERKTINSTDYTTTYSYDRQGNQTLVTLPDSTEIKYEYNNGGLLEKVSKKQSDDSIYYYLLEDADYNPLGQKTYENYANNTASYYIYDEDKLYRLEEKQTSIATSSLQHLDYTYDKVGNITKIIDSSNTNTAKTLDFLYDDLHRLTTASSTNAVSGDNFRETYSYNAIGNITNKSDVGNYLYQGTNYANPHAATSINGITNSYDNNGNLTSDSTWTHTWDYNNRLTQSNHGTATSTYSYDQDGNRIKKIETTPTASSTTIYINQYYEVEGQDIRKYIFAGGERVATLIRQTIDINPNCTPPPSGDWTISVSCTFTGKARAQGDVTVNAGAVLTIADHSRLEIDLKNHKLLVRHNGGVLIKKGGTLRQTTEDSLDPEIVNSTAYHHADHLSGANVDTDENGDVVQLLDYYPFGGIRLNERSGNIDNKRKAFGHEYDDGTDLYYMRARYQNPSLGRFLSVDPLFLDLGENSQYIQNRYSVQVNEYLADPQGLNSYSYAKNNPLKYVDVTGENPLAIAIAVLGCVIYGSLAEPQPAGDNNHGLFKSFSQQIVKIGRDIIVMEAAGAMVSKALSLGGRIVKTLLSTEGKNIGIGFKSFRSFKRAFGAAGEGKEWHHIVEQTGKNIKKFGEEQIHNTQNLMSVSKEVNQKINAYYSSKRSFTGGQTVRDWVSGQSYEQQYKFGQEVLSQVLKGGELR